MPALGDLPEAEGAQLICKMIATRLQVHREVRAQQDPPPHSSQAHLQVRFSGNRPSRTSTVKPDCATAPPLPSPDLAELEAAADGRPGRSVPADLININAFLGRPGLILQPQPPNPLASVFSIPQYRRGS